eukprot:TRINITY_DN4345_c0_g1_i2.p1 TRINITY_DN4345_c0_g1~~TRINITY_DN4345_c0_g1_i2.p1  ORF type:complete len:245 (-),score=40.45 TRINITY_DN4345_c0_g1_i2:26-760(-)
MVSAVISRFNRYFQPTRYIRSIIYGGLDGIITIFAIVASTSGASLEANVLLIIGCANLFADAFSMSVSDYLSSKAEDDERDNREKCKLKDIDRDFDKQRRLLFNMYSKMGYGESDCQSIVQIISKNKEAMALILVNEEQHNEESASSPIKSAMWTFSAFVFFGFLPLITFIFSGHFSQHYHASQDEREVGEFWSATGLTCLTLWTLGFMKAKFTGKDAVSAGLEMLILGGAAAGMAYAIAWNMS